MSEELLRILLVLALFGPGSTLGNFTLARPARAVGPARKYLIFPQGSNVQLVYCLTIGALAKPQGFFTIGVTAGLAYELPYRKTVIHRKPAEVYHRRSRRDLYRKVELMLQAQGKDGRECVLRALCQAGARNRQATAGEAPIGRAPFLEEILHAVFTYPGQLSSDDDEEEHRVRSAEYERAYGAGNDCQRLFPGCPQLF